MVDNSLISVVVVVLTARLVVRRVERLAGSEGIVGSFAFRHRNDATLAWSIIGSLVT